MDPRPEQAAEPHDARMILLAPRDMLRSIPDEILRKILLLADMPSRLCLGDTNTSYQAYVYRNNPWLWAEIDFSKDPPIKARALTDDSLHAWLAAVNARNVTTSLSLMGCTSIQGSGLAPLRGSQCLEIVDIHRSREEVRTLGETGLNNALVIDILSSMAPISGTANQGPNAGLKVVKFRKQNESINNYQTFSEDLRGFYWNLHRAIENQMEQRRVPCSYCNIPLCDKVPKRDFRRVSHTCYCETCKTHDCNMCRNTRICQVCSICMDQKCLNCGHVSFCELCNRMYCFGCKPTFFCPFCNNILCIDCRVPIMCTACNDMCCFDRSIGKIMFCQCCEKHYCTRCKAVGFCQGCDRLLCLECGRFCFFDDGLICFDCADDH